MGSSPHLPLPSFCPDHKMLAYTIKLAETQEGSSVSPEPSVPRGQGHTRAEH